MTFIVEKLREQAARNQSNLGYLRALKRFDRNSYESMINNLTSGLTSNPAAQLAISNSLNLPTFGLIIGGQVSGWGQSGVQQIVSEGAIGAKSITSTGAIGAKVIVTSGEIGGGNKNKPPSSSGSISAPPPSNPPLPF